MSFIALGINHKTASVALREQLAFDADRCLQAFHDASVTSSLNNLIILSTCNRTEVYGLADTVASLSHWLMNFCCLAEDELQPHIYTYTDSEALTHVIRVASGLDSMILGEPQIFGQLKSAVSFSQSHDMVNKQLSWLFEQVMIATKKIRSETRVGEQVVSLGYAVSKLAKQIFDDLQQNTLVLVASGEMNQLVARHMCQAGIGKVVVCNRSADSANALAKQLNHDFSVETEVVAFTELADVLAQGDIVSSSTGSLQTVIGYDMVKGAVKQRRYEPMLLVDLAVPRDIDSRVESLDSIYHYAIDDLQHVIEGNKQQRREASVNAEVMISQLVVDIQSRQRVKEASRDIAAYQAHTQDMSQLAAEKALQQLAQGKPADQVIQDMAYQLTAKLTHGQFRLLRDAASLSDRETMRFVLGHLLDADNTADTKNNQ